MLMSAALSGSKLDLGKFTRQQPQPTLPELACTPVSPHTNCLVFFNVKNVNILFETMNKCFDLTSFFTRTNKDYKSAVHVLNQQRQCF